jgi:hypothetical protein
MKQHFAARGIELKADPRSRPARSYFLKHSHLLPEHRDLFAKTMRLPPEP